MDLRDYLTLIRKRWIGVAIVTLAVLAVTSIVTVLSPTNYTARTTIFFAVQGGGSVSDLVQGSTYAEKQVQSYAEVAVAPIVLAPVIDELGLNTTVGALAQQVTATVPAGTVIIEISVVDENPSRAADIANAIGSELSVAVAALSPSGPDGVESVRATTISSATVPAAPSSPNVPRNLLLGTLLGAALGVGLAILREVMNTKVRTEEDVSRVTDASIVATIGFDSDASAHPLIVQADPHSARAEAYRRLRTNLQFLDIADRSHSIVITSSLPGEGKSTTSINLAIALAEAGTRVLLVDADLRRPQVAKYMQLEGRVGLTTVLIGRAQLADVVQPWGAGNLHVLPSGRVPPNPSELLGSSAMETLMESAAQDYDVILLDAPPLLPVTDSAVLAGKAGGALVVIGSDELHLSQLEDSLESLEAVDTRLLGLVLNKVRKMHAGNYVEYDYRSTYASHATRGTRAKGHRRRGNPRRAPELESSPRTTHPVDVREPQSVASGSHTTGISGAQAPPTIPPRRAGTDGRRGTSQR
ncbi:polysaccharide biosynthesis tyrosine autokinase [Occultella kanbiaonis]|uniref:polysaccharide biosynthesis tyrosine autokinase n=1 Tax=Occultella kanbiaonis TaxID=2675754 RepID=UPI00143CE7A9|nr:polysaccharide biosynthesis tyrosine autokinase [Occultella kanbiaonis]